MGQHKDAIGPTALRILAALMWGARRRNPPSMEEMRLSLGVSIGTIQGHLKRLRRLGMVTTEFAPCLRASPRTNVPVCRFIAAADLERSKPCGS